RPAAAGRDLRREDNGRPRSLHDDRPDRGAGSIGADINRLVGSNIDDRAAAAAFDRIGGDRQGTGGQQKLLGVVGRAGDAEIRVWHGGAGGDVHGGAGIVNNIDRLGWLIDGGFG